MSQLQCSVHNAQWGEIFHWVFHKPGLTTFFYWTPLLGTLCSTIFALFFLQHKMCCASRGAGWRPQWVMSCASGEASQWRLVPWVVRECPSYFLRGFEGADLSARAGSDIWIMAEPPYSGGTHNTCEHLHANVAMPNSCYVDDIYCCNSFTVAVAVFFANPDSKF